MKKEIIDRYARTVDDRVIIDITADNIENLYNNFDKSAHYLKKDLDQNLVDYLIESVREIGGEDFVIQFSFAAVVTPELTTRVQESIGSFFVYLRELEVRELKRMLRASLILLAVGIIIMTLSVWVNIHFGLQRETVFNRVFAEGLTVAAWISLWEALATFLINWNPHRRLIKLYERIAGAKVLFRVSEGAGT
ncbi:MAG: hypothetical protein V1706_14135 [Pseudomonadota bacterium]